MFDNLIVHTNEYGDMVAGYCHTNEEKGSGYHWTFFADREDGQPIIGYAPGRHSND